MRVQIIVVVLLLGNFVVHLEAFCCFGKSLQDIDLRNGKVVEWHPRPRCSCLEKACEKGDFTAFRKSYQSCPWCDKNPSSYDHSLRNACRLIQSKRGEPLTPDERKNGIEKIKECLFKRSNLNYPDYAKGFFDLMSIGIDTLIEFFMAEKDPEMVSFLLEKCRPPENLFNRYQKYQLGRMFQDAMPREDLVSLGTKKPSHAALEGLRYIASIKYLPPTTSLKATALRVLAKNPNLLPFYEKKKTKDYWVSVI